VPPLAHDSAAAAVGEILALLQPDSPLASQTLRDTVQARMSDTAGIICSADAVARALAEARALNADVRAMGLAPGRNSELARVIQRQQMALVSEAVLTALDFYIRHGGGSRGARAICDSAGDSVPQGAGGPLEEFRFRKEDPAHRVEQIVLRMAGGRMEVSTRPNRALDETARPFFERDWPHWLTGAIYRARTPGDVPC
jgi:succinate dehydrogenase / fumarate reductase flavoprotein subunit